MLAWGFGNQPYVFNTEPRQQLCNDYAHDHPFVTVTNNWHNKIALKCFHGLFCFVSYGFIYKQRWMQHQRQCNPSNDICTQFLHYSDVIMGTMASQITSLTIVYLTVNLDADQRKHQSSASLAFVRGIHRGPVNSPHKWPVTRKMFPFDDVIMGLFCLPLAKS